MECHGEKTHVALAVSLRKLPGDPDEHNILYGEIVKSARDIAASCVGDQLFHRIFNKPDESIRRALKQQNCQSMNNLRAVINDFEASLKLRDLLDENGPFFTILFDEVGSLNETGNGRFITLNRIIYRKLPLDVSDKTVQHPHHYACSTHIPFIINQS